MSEPARQQGQRVSPPMPPRPRSAQLPELHPNQEVILDEVGEGEMVENKLVMPDEFLQYLNQLRAGGTQLSYRGSPLPNCRSPICTNPLHFQRQQSPCNYNQQLQMSRCFMGPQPNTQPQNCNNYTNNSPYSQCPSSRMSQASGYCPPQNCPPQNCSSQIASPGSVQIMSPGSHYAPSHTSDQPVNSPAAGALPPPLGPQNLQPNTAQLSRNCPQNREHGYYPNGCQCQSGMNVNNQHLNTQPCSPMHTQIPQPCSAAHTNRPVVSCQPLSPQCPEQQLQNQRPVGNMVHNQCNMSTASVQCHQPMNVSLTDTHGTIPNSKPPGPGVQCMPSAVDQCQRVSRVCSPSGLGAQKQPTPISTDVQRMQTSPCPQMASNCVHPNQVSNVPKQRLCSQGNGHVQFCFQCCHPSNNDQTRYTCTNECQWEYCADQCYHHQPENGQEIQCRDISQSQQGSPMKPPQGMRQDSYRRTLEYVQQCRNWSETAQGHEANVSSSTHPLSLLQPIPINSNMILNDMTSSLNSLYEENRFLHIMQ